MGNLLISRRLCDSGRLYSCEAAGSVILLAMRYLMLQQRPGLTSRPLAVLVALCLLLSPVIGMATAMHELSHEAQEIAQSHQHQSQHDHADDHDEDDSQPGLHSVLHGVHVCGHGIGIPPSLMPPVAADAIMSRVLQPDALAVSAAPNLLFRPPRQN